MKRRTFLGACLATLAAPFVRWTASKPVSTVAEQISVVPEASMRGWFVSNDSPCNATLMFGKQAAFKIRPGQSMFVPYTGPAWLKIDGELELDDRITLMAI